MRDLELFKASEEPSPCGRHIGQWVAIFGLIASIMCTVALGGISYGRLSSDTESNRKEWQQARDELRQEMRSDREEYQRQAHEDREQSRKQNEALSLAINNLSITLSGVKEVLTALREGIERERLDRVDGEKRIIQMIPGGRR